MFKLDYDSDASSERSSAAAVGPPSSKRRRTSAKTAAETESPAPRGGGRGSDGFVARPALRTGPYQY